MLVVLTTLGDVSVASAQGEAPDAEPHLTGIDCPDPHLAGPDDLTADEDFTCAMLKVPLNHDDPGGPQLQLFTIGLPSTSNNPAPEPVIFLAGGPGQAGYPQLAQFSNESPEHTASFAQLRDTHDVVLIDQRGTGFLATVVGVPGRGKSRLRRQIDLRRDRIGGLHDQAKRGRYRCLAARARRGVSQPRRHIV